MAIEVHIQIDNKREDRQVAAKYNPGESYSNAELALMVTELEKMKLRLLNEVLDMEKDSEDYFEK